MTNLVTLSPTPILQFFDNNGVPLVGGMLTTQVGTLNYPVYSDSVGQFPLPNPIILNSRGEVATNAGTSTTMYGPPGVAYTFILQDAVGNTIWTQQNVFFPPSQASILAALTQNSLAAIIFGQTPAEALANITPANFQFPELNVHRYGAIGDGITDDAGPWNQAITVAATGQSQAGMITCFQLPYLLKSTLTLSGPASIDGGNSVLANGAPLGNGAQLRADSTLNGAIIALPAAASGNGITIRNINLVGTGAGVNSLQDGVAMTQTYPSYSRVFMQNVGVFNCGRYGINAVSMYTSDFKDVYVQGCQTGWVLGPNAGANRYYNCSAVANTSTGFDLASTNGTDYFNGCVSEQNQYGIVVESGGAGHKLEAIHTERNTILSVWFKSGSNKTEMHFEQNGSSESPPYNLGGNQNRWEGHFATGDDIYPISLQRVATSIIAQVTGSSLAAYTTGVPTISQGLAAMTQAIVPKSQAPTRLNIRANGFAKLASGGLMTISIFVNGICIKVVANAVTSGQPASFGIETDYITAPITLALSAGLAVGATGAILATPFSGVTGQYNLVFSDVELRNVTLTNGQQPTSNWAVGLLNAVSASATAYQQSYIAQVNIASNSGSDTVTLGGTIYGGVEVSNISIEEFRPSTG